MPTMYPKPVTPTRPMAMPTGTRSIIRIKSETKPTRATISGVLMALLDRLQLLRVARHGLRIEDQPVSADSNQQHCGNVANPSQGKERPGRKAKIESKNVVVVGACDLVEQRVGLHGDDKQQDERRKNIHP